MRGRSALVWAAVGALALAGGCSNSPSLMGEWERDEMGGVSTFKFDGVAATWTIKAMGVELSLTGDAVYDSSRGRLEVKDITAGDVPLPFPMDPGNAAGQLKERGLEIPKKVVFSVAFKNSDRIVLRTNEGGMIPSGAYTRVKEGQ